MELGDIQVRTRCDFTEILWRDKRGSHMLLNIQEGNFCNQQGNTMKPLIVEDKCHMAYVDKGDRMANS